MRNKTDSCTHLDAIVQKIFQKRPQSALSGWDRCLLLERKHGSVKLVFVSWQPQIVLGRLSERHFWTIRVARRLFNWRSNRPSHGSFSRATLPARSLPRSPRPSISWKLSWTVDPIGKITALSSESNPQLPVHASNDAILRSLGVRSLANASVPTSTFKPFTPHAGCGAAAQVDLRLEGSALLQTWIEST